jgi:hypothetical protein
MGDFSTSAFQRSGSTIRDLIGFVWIFSSNLYEILNKASSEVKT